MILSCISPTNAIHANMKAQKLGVAAQRSGRVQIGPTVRFWPVINNAGQYGQTRSVGETERPDRQSATALMPTGRNADHRKRQHVAAMLHSRHTTNHHLAA